jgi:ankyrin repeat protein/pimeloyl-ACP methyl ester carboxylesterase
MRRITSWIATVAIVIALAPAEAQERITIPSPDGGSIHADLRGKGPRGVVLAHGGRFNKESWRDQAEALAKAGFQVLAFDFRGYGQSTGPGQQDVFTAPLYNDVLAGVRYLRQKGATTISVIGGSLGGGAGADATIVAEPGEIDRLVFLGGSFGGLPPERMKGRKLFIISRDDASSDGPRLPGVQRAYAKIPEPKSLLILDGSAHAQFLFQTPHAERVMREILDFLNDASAKVDFQREVLPIFREHCHSCHGAAQQMGRFRLDRRRDAMRGGSIAVIAPGTSTGSRLYHKITSTKYGTQMPPTGPLAAEKIDVIRRWLDQGAPWPDEVAGDIAPPAIDADTARMLDALRSGDSGTFRRLLERRGAGGAHAAKLLLGAVLYSDAGTLGLMLKRGADPKLRNEVGATALIWAVSDLEKTRLLLDAGAEVNAKSAEGQTALSIAAARVGSAPVVRLLLERGAKLDASERSPLNDAASLGQLETMRVLLDSGQAKGAPPVAAAIGARCRECADLLLKSAKPDDLTRWTLSVAGRAENADLLSLLERGAEAKGRDGEGRTPLIKLASFERASAEAGRALIARGSDPSAANNKGETALDIAARHGDTELVRALRSMGAQARHSTGPALDRKPSPADSPKSALERSMPMIQRAGDVFIQKSGCVSCHHNSLASMSVAAARKAGVAVDEEIARRQWRTIRPYLEAWRERAMQGIGIPGGVDTVNYLLLGLAFDNYPPDAATDAMAHYLLGRQRADGHWAVQGHRPPLEASDIQVTATAMRAIQVYGPKPHQAAYADSVRRSGAWLASAESRSNEDRAFQLLGMAWSGAGRKAMRGHADKLLAEQRADGGWAQLPSMASDAYATGQSLVALREAGALEPGQAAHRRGIKFLMDSQYADGSWLVRSRSIPFQPFFETGVPFGNDQWISAAAINWAATALAGSAMAQSGK